MVKTNKPLFEGIKCLTRRYVITTLIILAVCINILFYVVEYFLIRSGYEVGFLQHQLVLFLVSIVVVVLVMIIFLNMLDGLRDAMILNLKKLIDVIRRQGPDVIGRKIEIEGVGCDDEVHEIIALLNTKNDQISRYVNHLHYVIGYIQHEFNTPLATLSLGLDRLKKNHPDIEITSLKDDIQELSLIVNSLAHLSQSASEPIERKHITINGVLQKVLADLQALYPKHTVRVTGNKGLQIMSHSLYLQLILRNLLENAMKYSSDTAEVVIEFGDTSLAIIDKGAGMSEEEVEHMWMPFWQADMSRGKDKGFGLGLALVQKLTEMLDIRVTVASIPGHGTTITLHFTE